MNHTQHNQIVSFIWSIADDVLRDVFPRGKYRDITLPFTVLRRLDTVLEAKQAEVVAMHEQLNTLGISNQESQLRKVAGYPFYNTSPYTFRTLLNDPAHIRQNLENYLDGFSANVQDIISKFKLRNQLDTLEESDTTYALIDKFCAKQINLGPAPVLDKDGSEIHPGLSNLGMGYVFEELIRRFNEANNEEAGEHFTPREIIQLMTHLLFDPLQGQLTNGAYLIYDAACGSGGMLTEAEKFAQRINQHSTFHLYGQEVNPETYAICKADMLIKGKDPDKIAYGSTLSKDGFPHLRFDFMLSNPPYGKTWKIDQAAIVDLGKKEIIDPRFQGIGVPRISDGQLLFLINMVSKMKTDTKLGSRIASVHNGSALFTGDAGSGESEMRRHLLENDLIEAIIQLPNNMFYNTGIATYIWVLNNRKPAPRQGKVQLIDASAIFAKMRKGLGNKSNELKDEHIRQITDAFLKFEETPISRIFDNSDFGYHSITVERPLRRSFELSASRFQGIAEAAQLTHVLPELQKIVGSGPQTDYNKLPTALDQVLKALKIKWKPKDKKTFLDAVSWRDEQAEPVVKKQDMYGTEYEPDSELRDYENVPLKEDITAYVQREVLPYVPDAWVDEAKTVVGYEITFTKIFYQYQPLRRLEDIAADILALEAETEGILKEIIA